MVSISNESWCGSVSFRAATIIDWKIKEIKTTRVCDLLTMRDFECLL